MRAKETANPTKGKDRNRIVAVWRGEERHPKKVSYWKKLSMGRSINIVGLAEKEKDFGQRAQDCTVPQNMIRKGADRKNDVSKMRRTWIFVRP